MAEIEPLFHTYDVPKPHGASFDEAEASRVVKWIESNLRHFKGRWAGIPFHLMAWEERLIRKLFGCKRSTAPASIAPAAWRRLARAASPAPFLA